MGFRDFLTLCVLVAIVAVLAFVAWIHVAEWRDARRKRRERGDRRWDPALCDHEWVESESGTCMNSYSSYGGPDPQAAWRVERCPHCGTTLFSCEGEMDARECMACRQVHERAPECGEITRTPCGIKADAHGVPHAVYILKDRFGNAREGYCRIVPTTNLDRCPDCGGAVEPVDGQRVRPGGIGDAPASTAFRCAGCGRTEESDFGVARVSYEEAALTFNRPEGLHDPRASDSRARSAADEEYVCPDCGGAVVLHPGMLKTQPTWIGTDCYGGADQPDDPWGVYVCDRCGRAEDEDFAIRCAHDWEEVGRTTDIEFPPGVDVCTENLMFAEEVERVASRCRKCGRTKTETQTISTGMPVK